MSHTVTVTRTTTTTTTSALLLNTGYLKTYPGLLKVAQLILGAAVVGIVGHNILPFNLGSQKPELALLLIATTFMIGTFCLLVSCIVSIATGSFIAKTIYEVVYHFVAFLLLLIVGLLFIIDLHRDRGYKRYYYDSYLIAAILGIVCVGIVGYYITPYYNYSQKPELFFLLMATTFMIGTFCLLLSCIISIATGSFIAKTVFEVVYHFVAFLLLLIAGIIFLVEINNHRYPKKYYDAYLAASILGLVNAVLYAISTFLAQRSYRGI